MTISADETLHCRCGGEVAIVQVTPEILSLGHVQNPRHRMHPVRLARAAAEAGVLGDIGGTRPQRERPATRREDVAPAGLSSLIANGTRPARKGRPRTANPSEAPVLNRGARPLNPPSGVVAGGGDHRAPRLSAGPRS